NYESLVSALLGAPPVEAGAPVDGGDAGSGETRWVFEGARSLVNRRTATDGGDASPASATLADIFGAQCKSGREIHSVCDGSELDAGETDASITDASGDAADAATDAA